MLGVFDLRFPGFYATRIEKKNTLYVTPITYRRSGKIHTIIVWEKLKNSIGENSS